VDFVTGQSQISTYEIRNPETTRTFDYRLVEAADKEALAPIPENPYVGRMSALPSACPSPSIA